MKLKRNYDPDENLDIENNEDDLLDNDLYGKDDFGEDLTFGDENVAPPMEKHKDLLLKLTDFNPYLKTQIMEWLGLYWDDEQKKYVKDDNLKPMMNIQGARWGINFLRTYTRDNNIITNFEYKEYKNMMRSIIKVSHYVPAVRAEEFGLQNDSDILTFANQLAHSASLILLGAGGNQPYTKLLGTAVTRHENINVSDDHYGRQNVVTKPYRKKTFIDKAKDYFGG